MGTDASTQNSAPPLAADLPTGLKQLFGFDEFRLGQRDVMEATLQGTNSLVVMPTGSGKSLCYQLPACVLDGITLVISPLIALMKDQVDALTAKNIPTTFINSSISTAEQNDRLYNMEMGKYKVVYIAPERFRSARFCDAIANTKIALLAIDEAHCISQWGHDFRPDYLTMASVREQLGHPPTIALTATATSQVQRDILAQLNLPEAEVFVYGFERPNLFFEVHDCRSKGEKLERIRAVLDHWSGESCLIYCATRKQVEEVGKALDEMNIGAGMYHGGLSDGERERIQDGFMRDEFPVLIATNAFGMGVDKSDIRAIVHYNIPGSIEAYYQEGGRAGRDGDPSHCLMLFNYIDRGIHEFFNDQTYPRKETVERVWAHLSKLGTGTHHLDAQQLADRLNRSVGRGSREKRLNSWGIETILRQLQRAGHVETGNRDGFGWIEVCDLSRIRDLRVDWEYLESRRALNEGLLGDVVRYASGRSCRQLYLLRYFNSRPSFEGGCGHCDVCCGVPEYAKKSIKQNISRITAKDPMEVVLQKLLSGVARAKGRYGAHLVAGAMAGSKAKKLQKTWLPKLSTYGVLSYLKQAEVVSLLDTSLRHGLLARDQHGCISLSKLGMATMKNPDEMPPDLRDILEATIVQRGGSRSARPARSTSRPQAARPRVTPAPPAGGAAPPPRADTSAPEAPVDDTYTQTLLALQEGMLPAQIARDREVKGQTVLRHMMVLANRGESFDISGMIDADLLATLKTHAGDWEYGEALAPLKAHVQCTYDELKIHLTQLLMDRHVDT